MDLLDAQPEFTKSFWDYLDLLVSRADATTELPSATRCYLTGGHGAK